MTQEPDLRWIERAYVGRPYGYGCLTPTKAIQPPGGSLNAVSRPQPIRDEDRDPGGHGSDKSNTRKALELLDWWDRAKEAFEELPGLWRSLLGILATPFRWIRWLFARPMTVVGIGVLCLGLLLLALPLFMTTNCGDSRRAEGEQLLGMARDFCRVQYSKSGNASDAAARLEEYVESRELEGKYFHVEARMAVIGKGHAQVYVYPTNPSDGFGVMTFEWASGNSTMEWHDFGERK